MKTQKLNIDLHRNSGQVVLILILITVVGLTIGLAMISRTITDIRITSQIEESSRAFSAAEAGVESALRTAQIAPTGTYSLNLSNSEASYKIDTLGKSSDLYVFPVTKVGQTQTLWFIEHLTDGTLDETNPYAVYSTFEICWSSNAALIATLLYKDVDGFYKIAKAAYEPVGGRNADFNVVTDTAGGYCPFGGGTGFSYKVELNKNPLFWTGLTLNPVAKLIMLRLQPAYFDTSIAVQPSASLPSQGKQVISVGKTNTGVIRKIQVTQGYFTLPEIFNFSFFDEQN